MTEDRITQRTITAVMIIITTLAFVFSFGNVWSLALRLGVPGPIAPLIAPMVDLSVVGLLVALRYLSLRGLPAEQMTAATRLMHFSGLLTLALNVAEPIAASHYGRAAVDAVAPLLLPRLGLGRPATPPRLPHRRTTGRPGFPVGPDRGSARGDALRPGPRYDTAHRPGRAHHPDVDPGPARAAHRPGSCLTRGQGA